MNYRRLFVPNCILFITIVTSKRREILIDNIEYLRKAIALSKQKFSYIWQRRYYEHTIAYEKDYNRHFDYIHYNPVKHGYVSAAKDWKFSSFHKYVKEEVYDIDWCNLEDKFNINDLDYE